jgi:hypothetical protein
LIVNKDDYVKKRIFPFFWIPACAGMTIKIVLRGFAPIGMLECWKSGIMGSGLRLGKDNAMLD